MGAQSLQQPNFHPHEETGYSWSRIHAAPTIFAGEAPLCVCIVDLECGLRLACKLLEQEGRDPSIGMRVRMVRLRYGDGDLFAARRRGAGARGERCRRSG
ncbi:MAG: OB-fold domain-containing protein [Variovorax sp.]